MTNLVEVSDAGHVRTIRLNRPEKKNALSQQLAWGVVAAIDEAAREDNVWVVALTGSGDAFCAGLDLSGAAEPFHPSPAMTAQLDDISWVGQFLLATRKRCDKPVVGGINGVAVGAGLGLAMSCDVRLIARSARLMAGYTRIGGSPDAGLTITLPQAMGYEKAMRFMMENRTLTGEEAVAWGMADLLVPLADVRKAAIDLAKEIAESAPLAVMSTRETMRRGFADGAEIATERELTEQDWTRKTEDFKEGVKSYAEKRPGNWKGR